jgi:hypothetical protein
MMQNKPEYETYPVSEEEMSSRYKGWMELLARYVVMAYNVGKDVGGQEYVERLKDEFRTAGQKSIRMWTALSGATPEDMADCRGIPKIQDYIDDSLANFWHGYIECSPNAFEKEVYTCPIARIWSKQPELCEILLGASESGMMEALNPKFKAKGFTKLLVKGDTTCRFRTEMED